MVVIRDIKLFLTFFKSEKPVAPFLFEKLKSLILLILQQFVKASIITEAYTNTFKLINLKLAKGISSVSPTQICSLKPEFMKKRFSLQELLQECNHLSTADGYKSTRQYNSLIENKGFLEEAKKFSIQDDRLDGFYTQIFVFIGLENFQIVLILSHDNVRMESGFSANGEILMENMLTVVA